MSTKKKLSTKPINIQIPCVEIGENLSKDPINSDSEPSEILQPEVAMTAEVSLQADSSILEYKKVAMRLSKEAAERLRKFRGDTGIPYEILVDVMVKNWDNLPQRTKNAYLKESQKVRAQRLIAGQKKAMLTTQKKYAQP